MTRLRAAGAIGCCSVLLGAVLLGGSCSQVDQRRHDVQTETVRDLGTGLMWQRAVPDGALTLAAATEYCANLPLAGHDDWRLPSLQEFQTIVDESRANPVVNVEMFPQTPSVAFWSGTRWAGTPMLAWHVDFDRGSAAYDTATTAYRVRCVRWGP